MRSYLLFFLWIIPILTFATIINIPEDYTTIQEGIDASVDSDTVLVQPGTYVENINYNGKNITVASLFLTTQDTTYISQTIIDGSQPENPDSASVVIFCNGEDSTTVLIGFTITGGTGTNYYYQHQYIFRGGGIHCCWESNPSLVNVKITENFAERGGGINCFESSLSLENVTISDNTAEYGGGIHYSVSSSNLVNVIITDNSADHYGGGIVCGSTSNICLNNVIISDNYAGEEGGGIFDGSSTSSMCLNNVIISDNYAGYDGGGINCWYSIPILVNVTISGNFAELRGGGIFCVECSPSLVNCILWNDSPQEVYFYEDYGPSSITISYSDIQGGEAGIETNDNGTVNWEEASIDENPLFVGTGEDPYSLLEGSPCIDTGTPDTTGLNLPPWDIIGNPRIYDGDGDGTAIIDMGVYEYNGTDADDQLVNLIPTQLHQNYPNPFNPTTTINFQISADNDLEDLELTIYNIKVQKVRKFSISNIQLPISKDQYSITWDGTDSYNQPVSSGIYLYKLKAGKEVQTRKMILLK